MRHMLAQSGKNIFWLLAGQFQVKGIGTEIKFARPLQRSKFRYSHLFKNPILRPSLEYATSGHIAKIDNAGNAVIEAEKQFVIL